MKRTRVKFCGFTRGEDVQLAVQMGVDAIGLIAVPGSKRGLTMAQASSLRALVPGMVNAVLLLMDPPEQLAREWIDAVQPDLLQFHGRETPAFCEGFGRPYLKALSGSAGPDLLTSCASHVKARGFVLDAHVPGGLGGTGQCFDWQTIPRSLRPACILSGGLTPQNVRAAMTQVAPFALDVASGIETAPGRKSAQLMYDFLAAVRAEDDQS